MSEQPSCWEALKQKIFPEEKGFAVLYGEAGVGKTSFSLTLAKNLKRKSLYVNTEGSPTYERALQIGVPPEVEFSDDWDEWGIMHDIIKVWGSKELLIIDSINSIFRVSASYNIESAFRAFSFI
ncbi:MAG: AAA family ATPase [Fervidicoccaceae archaeon]